MIIKDTGLLGKTMKVNCDWWSFFIEYASKQFGLHIRNSVLLLFLFDEGARTWPSFRENITSSRSTLTTFGGMCYSMTKGRPNSHSFLKSKTSVIRMKVLEQIYVVGRFRVVCIFLQGLKIVQDTTLLTPKHQKTAL